MLFRNRNKTDNELFHNVISNFDWNSITHPDVSAHVDIFCNSFPLQTKFIKKKYFWSRGWIAIFLIWLKWNLVISSFLGEDWYQIKTTTFWKIKSIVQYVKPGWTFIILRFKNVRIIFVRPGIQSEIFFP